MQWENRSDYLKTHFKDINESSNDCGNSQKAEIVRCKVSFPRLNYSDKLSIHFTDLNDASNQCENSQKAKLFLCKYSFP